jgi:hypothetical protein
MALTRWFSAAMLAGVLLSVGTPSRADEEPASPESPAPAPTPAADADSARPPWWGGRNLLYLEFRYGQSSVDEMITSVSTETGNYSRNTYQIEEATAGRLAVGWTLPDGRGQFLIAYEGVKEDGYRFDAIGEQATVVGGTSETAPNETIPWWFVSVRDGNLSTLRRPPFWTVGLDDADGDGRPSRAEVRYPAGTEDSQGSRSVPKSLNNRATSLDLLFSREFGGRRIWGSWSAGARYFSYDGAVPVAAWLAVLGSGPPGSAFTDGVDNNIITFSQDTTGFGPTGSLGLNFGFFRRKLVLHAGARVAYLLSSLETRSADFETFFYVSSSLFSTPATVSRSLDKSVWQLQAEFSAKFEVATGLHLMIEHRRSGYQDAMLFPVAFSVPDSRPQASQGTVAVFGTRDLRVQSISAGLSYQF